jgi:tRNA(His) 5'-end guanylyltransferase
MSEELAPHELREHFRAFELLDDDAPMRGFKRVVRCGVREWNRLYEHPALGFEKPFDVRFAKALVKTLTHLVGSDPDMLFGYAEHGEFSLLLGAGGDASMDAARDAGNNSTGRGLLSRVASNAGGKLSLLLGDLAIFDVRLYQFPSPELARIYFQWRQRCQEQLSLDRYLWHALATGSGDEAHAANIVQTLANEDKREILEQHKIVFEELPLWQRRGAGVYWQAGLDDEDPSLMVDTTLPDGADYAEYLTMFL